jgi:hypothetical protein
MHRFAILSLAVTVLATLAACGEEDAYQPYWPDARLKPPIDGSTGSGPDSAPGSQIDGAPGTEADASLTDAGTPDGSTGPAAVGDHLLLSEVMSAGVPAEFIEIYNPTADTIDLSDYYLSDSQDYARLPEGVSLSINSDFIVKFPAGATLAPRGVAVVAIDGAAFSDADNGYGKDADYAILNPGNATAMVQTDAGGSAGLTDNGEGVVLFFWDGESDLVKDVDIVMAGIHSSSDQNNLKSKTGVSVDGPDGDDTASTYADDALDSNTDLSQGMESPTDDNQSYKRIALEDGNETATGGNGIAGHDETSEATRTTWDSSDSQSYGAPTPGEVPASINPSTLW